MTMTLQHLLPSSLNEAIEDKFRNHPLYGYLRFVCLPIAAENQRFALTTGELFYHCVYSLDTLKGLSFAESKESCALLWSEIVEYLRGKEIEINDIEVTHAVSLIVYSVERCLLLSRNPAYTYPAGILQSVVQQYDAVFAHQLEKAFNRAQNLQDHDQLSEWLTTYMESNDKLSDEIEQLMDATEQAQKNILLMKKQSGFPLLTEQCYREHKEDTVIAELRAVCQGTAIGLWKAIRTNEALGYIIPTENLSAEKIYDYFTEYFGKLPYKKRNFREARNK